jgi:hypothetical protein
MALTGSSRRSVAFVGLVALFVSVVAFCVNRSHNGDVYLQLGSGRFVAEHGFVHNDPFATIAQGKPWHNQQWLTELVYYQVAKGTGFTGLTVFYALLLGVPLFVLLWHLRRKGLPLLLAGAALYFPVLLTIIHPRAVVFSLMAFALLAVLLLRADSERPRWALLAIPAVFALWANLHGGFVGGLALIAVVVGGMGLDHLRRLPAGPSRRRIALVALAGVFACAATMATPLGPAIWSYVASFDNSALTIATGEWRSVVYSVPGMIYVGIAAAFATFVWFRTPKPRPLMPVLVSYAFIAATLYAQRNMSLIPLAILFQIGWSRPDLERPLSLRPVALAGTAVAVAGVVALVLGSPKSPYWKPLADYAFAHPPAHGRIASWGGVGSYLLYRSPRFPVVINGWLEHYTPMQLRETYRVTWGRPSAMRYVDRLQIGGVITRFPHAVPTLQRHGFVVKLATWRGIYLVRERAGASARAAVP